MNYLIRNRNNSNIYVTFISSLLISFFSIAYLLYLNLEDWGYLTLFYLNCFIAVWAMMDVKRMPFSLKLLVNLFIYVFFILANGIQYALIETKARILSFHQVFTGDNFIDFQFIVCVILVMYNFFYQNYSTTIKVQQTHPKLNVKCLFCLSGVTSFLILLYFSFNPYQLFFRGLSEEMMLEAGIQTPEDTNNILELFFVHFIRPLPWACFLIATLTKQKGKVIFILFLLTLLTVFPTAIARNEVAMYWLPIFLIYQKVHITGRRFVYVTLFGILVIFPFLGNFRYFGSDMKFELSLEYLNSMNYDASQIFMSTIKTDYISYGYQLLGVLLFFVPRSIWPSKPVGSGASLAEANHADFTNVSMPYFGEGYVNAGFIGVVLFTILLAIFTKKFDTIYWSGKCSVINQGFYYIFCGAIIFILRGDLLSSLSFTIGTCMSFYFVSKLSSTTNDKAASAKCHS